MEKMSTSIKIYKNHGPEHQQRLHLGALDRNYKIFVLKGLANPPAPPPIWVLKPHKVPLIRHLSAELGPLDTTNQLGAELELSRNTLNELMEDVVLATPPPPKTNRVC